MLFPFVFTGPVVTIAAIAILWKEVGVSTLAGIAVVALFVGIQAAMSRLFSKFRYIQKSNLKKKPWHMRLSKTGHGQSFK